MATKESWDIGFAQMFRERDNKQIIGVISGKVISLFPDLQISILDGNAILYNEQLYCCNHILSSYSRQYTQNGNIQFADTSCGNTNSVNDGGDQASDHQHTIENLNVDTTYTTDGTITFTDTLKIDDEVLLIPTEKEDKWFIVDKVIKL